MHEFTIVKDKVSSIVIENKHKEGNVKVYKVDKDNHFITMGGIKFELYSEEFNKLVGTYVTDLNGEIHIKNLRTRKLYFKGNNKEKSVTILPKILK